VDADHASEELIILARELILSRGGERLARLLAAWPHFTAPGIVTPLRVGAPRWISAAGLGACIVLTAGCMAARPVGLKDVPASLKVPESQVLTIAARGTGVQIYECQASKADPAVFAWTLQAPDAQLHYEAGKKLGRHYAGPTWEAVDGSKVIAEVVAREDGPDATAIPWLLLRAKQTSGSGVFGAVQSIQRLHTKGGKAPPTGCAENYSGTEVRVAYSADYYFYAARP
jgi:hypothetical protein